MIKYMKVGTECPLKPARHTDRGSFSEVLAPELRYDLEIQNMYDEVVQINTNAIETCSSMYVKTKEGNSYCFYEFNMVSGKVFYSMENPWEGV